jgi:uncharacterized delta-60 repeat protein
MSGGDGNDQLTGSSGLDKFFGQNGNDFLVAQNGDADTVNGGANSDGTADSDLASIDTIDVSGLARGLQALGGPDTTPGGGSGSDLDLTFDDDGKAVGPDNLDWFPVATAVDSLGRIYFAGTEEHDEGGGNGPGNDFVVVRFTADGDFDSSFGNGGSAHVDFSVHNGAGYGQNDDDFATALFIDADDNILVAGSTRPGESDRDFAIARLTPAGDLDDSFGAEDGMATVDYFGFDDSANALAVQDDGKIVVVGQSQGEGSFGMAARLTAGGQLDGSFDDGVGRIALAIDDATAVAFQSFPDDEGAQRIVIGGYTYGEFDADFALTRLSPDGFIDGNFGSEGVASTDFGGADVINDIAVNSLNQIVAVGDASNFIIGLTGGPEVDVNEQDGILAVYSPDAQGAPSFLDQPPTMEGSSAVSFNGVTLDSSDRIMVVGAEAGDFITARFRPNLSFDTTFSSGFVRTDLSTDPESFVQSDTALDVFVVAGSRIVVAGRTDQSNESFTIAAVRFNGSNAPPNNETNVDDVEGFTTYDEIHDPNVGPPIKTFLDNSSETARLYTLSQLNSDGVAEINLGGRNDVVTLSMVIAGDGRPNVAVNVNTLVLYYDAADTTRIIIRGNGGEDTIIAAASVTVPLVLEGGLGGDILTGGAGDDVILGGEAKDVLNGQGGNDAISGGEGRDIITGGTGANLLIGGRANDDVTGGAGEDILVAGYTSYDNDVDALTSLVDVWGSTTLTRTQRISFIRNGGGPNTALLRTGVGATVFDDGVGDDLVGAGALDWFFFRNSTPSKDKIDNTAGEELTPLF